MKASVIVPLYNKAAHIRRSLESLSRQTFRNFEVIIVDDGSTDGSTEIARSFEDTRFRVVSQANAGPGAARNRGAAEAAGEFLAFLDADDEWLPEYLERNIHALEETGGSVVAISCGYLESGINFEPMWRARGLTEGIFTASPTTPPLLLVHTVAYMSPWNTLIRAEAFKRLGGFYGRTKVLYAEDAWLWVQVLLNHSVLISFSPPLALFHREASELSANVQGARPVEPFLLEAETVRAACPAAAQRLLRDFLAIRAFKTACVLGYWGKWREANQLRKRFGTLRDFRLPYFWPALVCSSSLGGLLGGVWRKFGSRMPLTEVDRIRHR